MVRLNYSDVLFNEEAHTYTLGDKKLKGITGLIGHLKCPHKYDFIPKDILEEAARLGTEVHKACQLFDEIGDMAVDDELLQETKFYDESRNGIGFSHIANEYTVSDNEHWASNIDCVWANESGDICLADIKTTSEIDEEYLSWQLSIYAYLFEMQNPELKVSDNLYCVLLFKKGKTNKYGMRKFVKIIRKSEEDVKEILSHVDYENEPEAELPAVVDNNVSIQEKIINEIVKLEHQKEEIENQEKELREAILEAMKQAGAKSFKCDALTISYKDAYKVKKFDSARFKKEQSSIYEEYLKESEVKESITIKINKTA